MKSSFGANRYDHLKTTVRGGMTVYTLSLVTTKMLESGTPLLMDKLEKDKKRLVEFSLKLLRQGSFNLRLTVTCEKRVPAPGAGHDHEKP